MQERKYRGGGIAISLFPAVVVAAAATVVVIVAGLVDTSSGSFIAGSTRVVLHRLHSPSRER